MPTRGNGKCFHFFPVDKHDRREPSGADISFVARRMVLRPRQEGQDGGRRRLTPVVPLALHLPAKRGNFTMQRGNLGQQITRAHGIASDETRRQTSRDASRHGQTAERSRKQRSRFSAACGQNCRRHLELGMAH
jgi:hypothetical protein